MRFSAAAVAITIAGLVAFAGHAVAVTQSVAVNITFDSPLSLTKQSDISFGTIKAEEASTYTISPNGAVSHTGNGAIVSGMPMPGNITIMGSSTQSVNITATSYVAHSGVALQNATCSYGGGPAGSCTISGAPSAGSGGKVLLVGIDAIVDGTQVAGTTAAPSFTISVTYQ